MKRTVLLWALALCSIASSYGMENEVSLLAQKEMITVKFIGGQDPEKGSEIQAPKKYIELSDVLKQQLEGFEGKNICIISLDSISLNTFKQLIDLLPSVHNLSSSSEQIQQEAQSKLKEMLTKKTDEELVLLANGADYLDIELLIESIVQVIVQRIINNGKEYIQQYKQDICFFRLLNQSIEQKVIQEFIPQPIKILNQSKNKFNIINISSDGKYIVLDSFDYKIKICNTNTGQCIRTLKGHEGIIRSINFSSDNKKIISGSEDGKIKIWDIENGTCIKTLQLHKPITAVNFSPDGNKIVFGFSDIKFGDKKNEFFDTLIDSESQGYILWVNFSPDGNKVIANFDSGKVKIWDVSTCKCRYTLLRYAKWVNGRILSDLQYSHADNSEEIKIISNFFDGTVKILDIAANLYLCAFPATTIGDLDSINFSPDDKYRVSSAKGTIKIWPIAYESIYEFLGVDLLARENWNSNLTRLIMAGIAGSLVFIGYKLLQRR